MRQRVVGQNCMEKKKQEKRNEQSGKPAREEADGEREELLILHVTTSEVETARLCTGTRVTPAVWETGQYSETGLPTLQVVSARFASPLCQSLR